MNNLHRFYNRIDGQQQRKRKTGHLSDFRKKEIPGRLLTRYARSYYQFTVQFTYRILSQPSKVTSYSGPATMSSSFFIRSLY